MEAEIGLGSEDFPLLKLQPANPPEANRDDLADSGVNEEGNINKELVNGISKDLRNKEGNRNFMSSSVNGIKVGDGPISTPKISFTLDDFPRLHSNGGSAGNTTATPDLHPVIAQVPTPVPESEVGAKDWSSLFVKEAANPLVSKLPYFKPPSSKDKKIYIPPSDFVDEIRVCEKSIVGYFVGRRTSYPNVESTVKRVWKLKGNFRLSLTDESIFIFNFDLEEDRVTALEHGSMFISSRLFMIRPWQLFLEESIHEMKSIPIWVKLRKIPLHLWNAKGLGMIASALGTPLLADKHTLEKTRLSFARVCVEIEVEFDYPDSISISFGEKDYSIPVEYTWKPQRCVACATFGHPSSHCSRVKRIWVPKEAKGVSEEAGKGALKEPASLAISTSMEDRVIEETFEDENGEAAIPALVVSTPLKELTYSRNFKRAPRKEGMVDEAPCCVNSFSLLEEEEDPSTVSKGDIEDSNSDSEGDESVVEKLKSLEEVTKYQPMDKKTHMDKLMKFSSALNVSHQGNEEEVKNIFNNIADKYQKSRKERELQKLALSGEVSVEHLGRGLRNSAKKK